MDTYDITLKCKFLLFFGVLVALGLLLISGAGLFSSNYFIFMLHLIPAVILLHLVLFVFPTEISIQEEGMIYKTPVRTMAISWSRILDIKPVYTTRSLKLAGGDKDKADMFCIIRIKGRPFRFLAISNGVRNYKDLYARILSYIAQS